ncbi:hypothetical protein HY480_00805 [Candidatus Uhrbacteria bacterium]|nr:hypothetical protein [Candidatus Uhrbacteria bacterium]
MRRALLQKMIVCVMLCSIALGACGYMCDQGAAESEAKDFLATMYPDKDVIARSCAGMDSDGDNYVSCTARVRGKTTGAAEETLALECAASFTLQSGCRLQRAGAVVNR